MEKPTMESEKTHKVTQKTEQRKRFVYLLSVVTICWVICSLCACRNKKDTSGEEELHSGYTSGKELEDKGADLEEATEKDTDAGDAGTEAGGSLSGGGTTSIEVEGIGTVEVEIVPGGTESAGIGSSSDTGSSSGSGDNSGTGSGSGSGDSSDTEDDDELYTPGYH